MTDETPVTPPVQPPYLGIPPENTPAAAPPVATPPAYAPPAYTPPAYVPAAQVPPPYAPPGFAPPGYAGPPAGPTPRRRRLWPFFLGGGVLLLILLIVGGIVAASLISAAGRERDRENVEQAILDFDSAYENADCGDFEDVTTDDFRDTYADTYYGASSFDCDDWESDAEGLSPDGDYLYNVEVNKVVVYTNEAQVRTTEQADGDEGVDFVYELERIGGRWLITGYEED